MRTLLACVLIAGAGPAAAEVVALDVARTVPAFGGQEFGAAGAYEAVYATARYEVDPRLPINAMLRNI
mgnify:CR=1 FL=1